MNKMHTPKDSDPFEADRTEPRIPPQSNYIDSIGHKDFKLNKNMKNKRFQNKPNE